MNEYDQRHGGPYDRGSADAYYRRAYDPHYYIGDTHASQRVEQSAMTEEELRAYTAGYTAGSEPLAEHKNWGGDNPRG